MMHGQKNIKLL